MESTESEIFAEPELDMDILHAEPNLTKSNQSRLSSLVQNNLVILNLVLSKCKFR